MAKVLGDLNLEDEHVTIGVTDRVREAAHRLMDVPGGVLVVLDDQERPCGIVRPDHVLGYVLKGGDLDHACCRDIMESDLLRLPLTTPLSEVIEAVDARRPAAVVALDDHGEHAELDRASDECVQTGSGGRGVWAGRGRPPSSSVIKLAISGRRRC